MYKWHVGMKGIYKDGTVARLTTHEGSYLWMLEDGTSMRKYDPVTPDLEDFVTLAALEKEYVAYGCKDFTTLAMKKNLQEIGITNLEELVAACKYFPGLSIVADDEGTWVVDSVESTQEHKDLFVALGLVYCDHA